MASYSLCLYFFRSLKKLAFVKLQDFFRLDPLIVNDFINQIFQMKTLKSLELKNVSPSVRLNHINVCFNLEHLKFGDYNISLGELNSITKLTKLKTLELNFFLDKVPIEKRAAIRSELV